MPLPSRNCRVPIRLAPQAFESLKGFLLRTAIANGYRDPKWILEAANTSAKSLNCSADLGQLSSVLDVKLTEIERRRYLVDDPIVRVAGNQISRSHLDPRGSKICPACISERGYVDIRWDVSLWAACPRHAVALIERCTSCGRKVTWRRRALNVCDCGSDFARQLVAAPQEAVEFVEEMDRRFNWCDGEQRWELNDALEMVWLAATYSRESVASRRRYASRPTVRDALQILSDYGDIVLTWPDGLHRWLSQQRVNDPERTGIHADYGPVLRKIQLRCRPDNPAIPEVRKHLANSGIVLKHWSFFYSSRETQDVISGAEAAKLLRVRNVGLNDLVREGVIRGETRRGGGRSILTVSRNSVEDLIERFNSGLTIKQVSTRLGLTKHQIEKLFYSKIIESLPKLGKKNVKFPRDVCDVIEKKIIEVASPVSVTGERIALANVPSRHQEEFGSVLQRVLSRDVPCAICSGSKPLMQRVYVPVECLRDDGLGVREAASVIGVHERMIPHLIAAGCLQQRAKEGRRYRSIGPANIQDFQKAYVLTREVAAALKTNTRTAISRLRSAGCVAVVEHCSASQISAVWRRSQVESVGLM